MVHGLAAQSGGVLNLSSLQGQGTTVSLWLPIAGAQFATKRLSDAIPPDALPLATRALKVLVVDDDTLVSMGTTAMLEDLGHDVTEASAAAAALQILCSDESFDLVITDHAMPGMTGAELARLIFASYPGLRVILASGYAELPDDHGLVGVLRMTKPFTQEQLQATIQRAISEKANAS
jgi:CheY-like chemotaxis protein